MWQNEETSVFVCRWKNNGLWHLISTDKLRFQTRQSIHYKGIVSRIKEALKMPSQTYILRKGERLNAQRFNSEGEYLIWTQHGKYKSSGQGTALRDELI